MPLATLSGGWLEHRLLQSLTWCQNDEKSENMGLCGLLTPAAQGAPMHSGALLRKMR